MPNSEYLCNHFNQIIDAHNGCYVCTQCGLVMDTYFHDINENVSEDKINHEKKEEICELLEKLNYPTIFVHDILANYVKNKELKKEARLPYIVYETLNSLGFPISLKEISAVSGLNQSRIYDMQQSDASIVLKPSDLLEKYCKMLNLDYRSYSLIKETMQETSTGHNPLTIIAASIYKYCKVNKLKHTIKEIAQICNISPVSIQRYIKL